MSIKASDLLKQLENDLEYQAMRRRKEQELAERKKMFSDDEKELIEELNGIGYGIKSVWDFVNNDNRYEFLRQFEDTYQDAYKILVKHLNVKHHPIIREGIIRALTQNDANSIASEALLDSFYKETDSNLKWVLANALRTVLTRKQKNKHPEYKQVYSGHGKP